VNQGSCDFAPSKIEGELAIQPIISFILDSGFSHRGFVKVLRKAERVWFYLEVL
jgi:hypothetical protein